MNTSNRLSRLIRDGSPALGMWLNMSDPATAQIAAVAGYDWVLIDTEHNPFTETHVLGHILALQGEDVTPIVRIRSNREEHVKWVLDSGAGGLVIPSIRDAADAAEAVRISKYHPLGNRGYGPNRASAFWTKQEQYLERANRDILLICQIELASAVRDAAEICQMEGIDAVWIGPADLAQSLGHLGNISHPEVQDAIARVIDIANRFKKPWGMPAGTVADCLGCINRGGTVMILGTDTRFLRASATDHVASIRAALRQTAAEDERAAKANS